MLWMIQNVAQHLGACADPQICAKILPPAARDNVLDTIHSSESPGDVPTWSKMIAENGGPAKDGVVRLKALS